MQKIEENKNIKNGFKWLCYKLHNYDSNSLKLILNHFKGTSSNCTLCTLFYIYLKTINIYVQNILSF